MNAENVNVTVNVNRRSSSNNYKSYCNSTRIRTLFLLSICSLIVLMIIYAILYNNKKYLQLIMISSPITTKTVRPSTTTTTTTTTVQTVDEAAPVIEATNTTTTRTRTTDVDSSNTNNSSIKLIRDTALHYQTTKSMKSTNQNQNTKNQNTNQNELFINTFADCVLDPTCHLLYHHVGKTGGTTIEKIFYTLFPKPIPTPTPTPKGSKKIKQTSCCFSDMLHRFQQDPYYYCLQQKFSAFQVRGKQFETIVLQCLDIISNVNYNNVNANIADDDNNSSSSSSINLNLNNTDDDISTKNTKHKNKNKYKNKSTKKRRQRQRQRQRIRFLTFSTYREPIARTISDIHQLCNKNLNRRTKQLQEVCQRCTYDTNTVTNNNATAIAIAAINSGSAANSTATSATSVTVPGISMNDKVYWNKLIHNTNRIYRHLDYLNKHLLRHSQYRQSQNQNQNTATTTNTNNSNNSNNNINIDSSPIVIDYLMMDVIDIDDFLHRLDHSLVMKQLQQQQQQQSQKQKQTPSRSSSSSSSSNTKIIRIPYLNNDNKNGHGHGHVIKSNQESIKFCNFGKQIRIKADTQTSTSTSSSTVVELEIVELLQTSIDIYNNFTTNLY